MNRHAFLGKCVWRLLVAACLLSFSQSASTVLAERRQPNVILILADDLGYGDLGCFGQKTL